MSLRYRPYLSDERYINAIKWGKVRSGHSEGGIENHINELHNNLNFIDKNIGLLYEDICRLEVLIDLHDAFKGESVPKVAINDLRSHASIAAKYAIELGLSNNTQWMIQNHDVPFSIYRKNKPNLLKELFNSSGLDLDSLRLFFVFLLIDNVTSSKDYKFVEWLLENIPTELEFYKKRFESIADILKGYKL